MPDISIKELNMYVVHVTFLLVISSTCSGYQHYQQNIPHGDKVPHPCIPGDTWQGVGHKNHRGGGDRNVFGLDFKSNNFVWDEILCNKDSDGDGKTNGAELGDPDCTWTPGNVTKFTSDLSHPGVCQPLDDPKCKGKTDFVDCNDNGKFQCAAVDEQETFNYTVKFPITPVPDKETTYMCMNFVFPSDREYHMVATEPLINNTDVMHHLIIYGCEGDATDEHKQPYVCGMQGSLKCQEFISGWAVGGGAECFNSNSGFLIGGSRGFRFGKIEVHWNNPQKKSGYTDSSGILFHLTPKLRPHNSGTLVIGQTRLVIPTGQSAHAETGVCGSQCTPLMLNKDIHVTSVLNHMHNLGASQFTELRRNGERVTDLAKDENYIYGTVVNHRHPDTIVVKPGDELKTTCVFNSVSSSQTTYFGKETSDEMCFSFLTFYPKENTNFEKCVSWGNLSFCDRTMDGKIDQGCDIKQMTNLSNPETMATLNGVIQVCLPDTCIDKCLEHVRKLKKEPCFSGDMDQYLRRMTQKQGGVTMKSKADKFYARLDSCNRELKLEDRETNSANKMASISLAALFTIAVLV